MDDPTDPNREETEEDALYAGARRNLKVRLFAAGLLDPKRSHSEESFAIEMRIRHEEQAVLDSVRANRRRAD